KTILASRLLHGCRDVLAARMAVFDAYAACVGPLDLSNSAASSRKKGCMTLRYFALVLGIIFLLVGVMGFIPALVTMPPDMTMHNVTVHQNHGYLLGLFPVNLLHNLVHILFGIWGIAAYATGFDASRLYARGVAIIYALLAIMGLFPQGNLNTTFGLIPI